MKVKELIEELQKMPQDIEVVMTSYWFKGAQELVESINQEEAMYEPNKQIVVLRD